MSIHDNIEQIEKLTQEIFDHVGYVADWTVYPLDDKRDVFWWTDGQSIKFCTTKEKLLEWLRYDDDSGECYSNIVINRGVHRGAEITAVVADTMTDNNRFLMLLRNENEVNDLEAEE